ncbi:MAG: tRNA (cytidine(34)-2'-O)-methyltransferase [Verrucomicrobia bacterium]|nr:tRNA (cytidine(34)-2'-O)-methyltransferase [Verrucomicrobiota bacterium]
MFNVVLVEPEIPPNTGSVARLCLATGSTLHLVKPLGFSTDDRYLRRAGMDYWPQVRLRYWESLAQFLDETASADGRYFLTTKVTRPYWETRYHPEDFLVFGRETKGLPETLLKAQPERCLKIPMRPEARSLNLATAVAIVLFEAVRQTQPCDF